LSHNKKQIFCGRLRFFMLFIAIVSCINIIGLLRLFCPPIFSVQLEKCLSFEDAVFEISKHPIKIVKRAYTSQLDYLYRVLFNRVVLPIPPKRYIRGQNILLICILGVLKVTQCICVTFTFLI